MSWIRKTLLALASVTASPSFAQEQPTEWNVTVEDCVILNNGLNAWTVKYELDLRSAAAVLDAIKELDSSIRVMSRPVERTPDRLAEDERFLQLLRTMEDALDPILEAPNIAAQNANEAFRRMCPREYMPQKGD